MVLAKARDMESLDVGRRQDRQVQDADHAGEGRERIPQGDWIHIRQVPRGLVALAGPLLAELEHVPREAGSTSPGEVVSHRSRSVRTAHWRA